MGIQVSVNFFLGVCLPYMRSLIRKIRNGLGPYSYPRYVRVFSATPTHPTISQLPDMNAKSFTVEILKKAMLDTLAALNQLADEAGITEVVWR